MSTSWEATSGGGANPGRVAIGDVAICVSWRSNNHRIITTFSALLSEIRSRRTCPMRSATHATLPHVEGEVLRQLAVNSPRLEWWSR